MDRWRGSSGSLAGEEQKSDKAQNSFKQGTFLSKLRDSRFCRNLMMAARRWAAHTAFWSSCARSRK